MTPEVVKRLDSNLYWSDPMCSSRATIAVTTFHCAEQCPWMQRMEEVLPDLLIYLKALTQGEETTVHPAQTSLSDFITSDTPVDLFHF
ncbi:hypothetical protein BgiMline_007752 [Biomphalaria glabrata]|nr:hypothetical protein BgiMline_018446 [Biomphalaria glabrata]KAI8788418.1 hypothetical protein BgiBS90_011086 [Biomphalaria glabrata]